MTYLPESLRTIHLDTYLHPNSTADEVFTNWITLHSPWQINHVALLSVSSAQIDPPNPHNRHVGHISCYVGSCRFTGGGQIHEIDVDVFDLSKLAALRSLGIHARDDFNTGISPVRMFIQMLKRPPPRLAKVSLVLDYRGALQAQESRIEDWKELDILLASEPYAKVFMKVYLGLRIGANGLEDLAWYNGTERDFKDLLCRCIELQRCPAWGGYPNMATTTIRYGIKIMLKRGYREAQRSFMSQWSGFNVEMWQEKQEEQGGLCQL
ncbi:hypothetical protein PM082_006604 [Marasmius tenuissimus]|nr:hypothetical protein PM082_006604 [Marasmius tenuissimus]